MKIAIVYHSESGNTKTQAELVEEGVKSVEGTEVKTMSINDIDKEWCSESKAVIFGSPTYEGTCSWQMKKFLDTVNINYDGKLAGFFATQNWPGGGGADLAEITMIAAALIHGMLIYSGGIKQGMPPIHFGAVSHKAPTTEFDRDRAVKLGVNIATKAMEIF
jgi:NAD(P)H dehydrogenase (quinone)